MADMQELRCDLAAALRWAARLDLNEGVDNHFSLAVPDDDGVVGRRRRRVERPDEMEQRRPGGRGGRG